MVGSTTESSMVASVNVSSPVSSGYLSASSEPKGFSLRCPGAVYLRVPCSDSSWISSTNCSCVPTEPSTIELDDPWLTIRRTEPVEVLERRERLPVSGVIGGRRFMVLCFATFLTVPKSQRSSSSEFASLPTLVCYPILNKGWHLLVDRRCSGIVVIISSATFRLPSFVALDKLSQIAYLLCQAHKLVFQQVASGRSLQNVWMCIVHLLTELTSRGSRWRQRDTNSRKVREKFPSSVGGEFLGIRNRTLMANFWCQNYGSLRVWLTFIGCSSAYGGSPLASSIAVMPRLQISALWSYPDCLITSGLIQYGVPTKVFFLADSVPDNWPDTPKSASLTAWH